MKKIELTKKKDDTRVIRVIWTGIQNSKTPGIKILSDEHFSEEELENGFGPYWGSIYEVYGSDPKFIFSRTPKEYLVYAANKDVEVVKSDGYNLFTWDTGGYGNTGCQCLLCCTPGTIIISYGYKRRDYGYLKIEDEGKIIPLPEWEVIKKDEFKNGIVLPSNITEGV